MLVAQYLHACMLCDCKQINIYNAQNRIQVLKKQFGASELTACDAVNIPKCGGS